MPRLPQPPSKSGKDNITRRNRSIATRKEDHSRDRKESRSAWSLASPRFDLPETSFGRHTNQYREHESRQKRTGNKDCASVHSMDDLDLEIDIDSDAEILLTPLKAKKLVQGIRDIIETAEKHPQQRSPCDSSFGSLMSFETESFDENPQRCCKKTKCSSQLDDEQNLKLDIDEYIRERYPSCSNEEKYQNDFNVNYQDNTDMYDGEARTTCPLENLERKMSRLENELQKDRQSYHENRNTKDKDQEELVKALILSAQLLGLNAEGHFDPSNLKEQLEREKNEEIDSLRGMHEKEILNTKEEYKEDVIDLQDRMLQWMNSRVDLVRQQERTILGLKYELDCIRSEYKDLKETSIQAFDKGTQSVAINCSTLKSYIQEEIKEADDESENIIAGLKDELKNAQDKIESLEKCTVECEGYQPMASVSSLDSNSARQQQQLDDRHAHSDCDSTWNDFTVKIRDALEGNLPQTSSLPPSDASVVSKLEIYDTMTADKLFKKLCYDKKSPRPLSRKKSGKSDSSFFDCGEIIEDADIFMDAES